MSPSERGVRRSSAGPDHPRVARHRDIAAALGRLQQRADQQRRWHVTADCRALHALPRTDGRRGKRRAAARCRTDWTVNAAAAISTSHDRRIGKPNDQIRKPALKRSLSQRLSWGIVQR